MGMVVGMMRSQVQMDDVHTVSLYYNQVIANLEKPPSYMGAALYLRTQRETLILLSWSETFSLSSGRRYYLCIAQLFALQASLQR